MVFMQWLWLAVIYSNIILSAASYFLPKSDNSEPIKSAITAGSSQPGVFVMVFGALVTITMMVLAIYVIIKIPSTLAKTSKKVVHEAADNIAPIVLKFQKKPETKRRRIKLTFKLIVIMKSVLALLPLILTLFYHASDDQCLDYSIAIYISIWLAAISVVLFVIQYLLIYTLKVKKDEISL